MAPLIDIVFLLLIYFMVTASLIKKEGDIPFLLPSDAKPIKPINVPVEIQIEIDAAGAVQVEGVTFPPQNRMLDDLVLQMKGLRRIAQNQQSPFFVNLLPSGEAIQDRIVDVMDACSAAGVTNLTFSKSM